MEMRLPLFIVLIGLLGMGNSLPGTKGNSYVSVVVTLSDTVMHQGDSTVIRASLTPEEGIHINIDPPVTITLRMNHTASSVGETEFRTDKETGFLSTADPVEQRLAVSPTAATGADTLEGAIVYYFCSDAEGWCRKQTQSISLPIHILVK
jgi:hypothetical protein